MHRTLLSLPILFYGVMFMHMAGFAFNFTETMLGDLLELLDRGSLANKH
jgi:hypothetical protein